MIFAPSGTFSRCGARNHSQKQYCACEEQESGEIVPGEVGTVGYSTSPGKSPAVCGMDCSFRAQRVLFCLSVFVPDR
jgi:hypothetical protein